MTTTKWYIPPSYLPLSMYSLPFSQDIDSDKPLTDPSEARQFSQVITGLQKTYPRDKMEEISTSFCFICLLHLANEQGLTLESTVADDEGVVYDDEDVADQGVGDILNINVSVFPLCSEH